MAYSKSNPTFGKESKKAEHDNPFFRGREKRFEGGAQTVSSPVGSVFNCPTRSTNVMEEVLAKQTKASRGDTFGKKGGRK